MLESAVEAIFAKRVRQLGGLSYKFAPVHAGNPDRIVLLPDGLICFVELKADGGKLDPAQVLWHKRAKELGTNVYVVTGAAEARAWSPAPVGYSPLSATRARQPGGTMRNPVLVAYALLKEDPSLPVEVALQLANNDAELDVDPINPLELLRAAAAGLRAEQL